MTEVYGKALATIQGSSDDSEFGPNGGFRAVLSTPSLDRDGDRLLREEWRELPQWLTLDMDHGMSTADTVGKFHPYWDGDRMLMDAHFTSLPEAQRMRTLIKDLTDEGGNCPMGVSVAFLTDKSQKDGEPRRELLNAGITPIPSNRDAVIIASKAAQALRDAFSDATEGDVPEEVKSAVLEILGGNTGISPVHVETLNIGVETKAPEPYGDVHYADPAEGKYPIDTVAHIRAALAYLGVEHNRAALGDHLAHVEAAVHAAARSHGIDAADPHGKSIYVDIVPRVDEEALKRVLSEIVTKAGGGDAALIAAIHDASVHLGAQCVQMEPEDPDDGANDGANKNLETFEKALDEILTSQHGDSPEAPAPTDEVPAPASPDEAADVAFEQASRALRLRLLLSD